MPDDFTFYVVYYIQIKNELSKHRQDMKDMMTNKDIKSYYTKVGLEREFLQRTVV